MMYIQIAMELLICRKLEGFGKNISYPFLPKVLAAVTSLTLPFVAVPFVIFLEAP